jgi:hypothetical protein
MKRLLCLSVVALLGWTAGTSAAPILCHSCGCRPEPPPYTPDCGDPCCGRIHIPHHPCKVHKLLDELCSGDCCCVRIRAARRLGHRWIADFCTDGDILPALVRALLCDPCWEVRRAAAWALCEQDARTEFALMALYISSRLDRHYMVRSRALEAIDIITRCRKECYKEMFKVVDALCSGLSAEKVRPGACKCEFILTSLDHLGHAGPVAEAAKKPNGNEMPRVPNQEEIKPPVDQQNNANNNQ